MEMEEKFKEISDNLRALGTIVFGDADCLEADLNHVRLLCHAVLEECAGSQELKDRIDNLGKNG